MQPTDGCRARCALSFSFLHLDSSRLSTASRAESESPNPAQGNIGAQRKESEDMIKLHQGQRWRKLPNMSPPCVKLETWLRMAEIPYEMAPPDLAEAPKGKVPFIEDAGVKMGDSTLIVEHLK